MENTGRIKRGLTSVARQIVYHDNSSAVIDAELSAITQVDEAHLVMLTEQGIIQAGVARAVILEIGRLRESQFAALRELQAPRGIYLLYESYLSQALGPEIGGVLQTARSRNDLNATVLKMRLRQPYIRLARELERLQLVLVNRAKRYARVTMPAYTHNQAAVPITLGHYLAGVTEALARDATQWAEAGAGLEQCPLGAGAVGGTSLPICPERTALLLGFTWPVRHSVDAVASRDVILRLLAAAAILGVTLSRLAADLLQWLTTEFGFLTLPDHLVGSSSMMPQKRNPFLLEIVQGRSAVAIGALTSALTAMQGRPFTNSVAVGTEGIAPIWHALDSMTDCLTLTRLVVRGIEPIPESMLARAESGFTIATELANRMAAQGVMSFRQAHHLVGALVCEAERTGEPLACLVKRETERSGGARLDGLSAEEVALSCNHGGGAGLSSLQTSLEALRIGLHARHRHLAAQRSRWQQAQQTLDAAVRSLLEPENSIGSGNLEP